MRKGLEDSSVSHYMLGQAVAAYETNDQLGFLAQLGLAPWHPRVWGGVSGGARELGPSDFPFGARSRGR